MRPYIVINGVSSNTINGLLIQSLPPITKPQMRTTTEEIAGRDGDIVTTTGYKAYDKTISVGLYGDYNVDEIIEYLAQSGEIVFSNELDKYYNFAAYSNVDYEKLCRFRQASVNFHTQPFKYDNLARIWEQTNSNTRGVEIDLENKGNVKSKPTITVTGTGIIRLYINEVMLLVFTLTNNQTIILNQDGNATDLYGNFLNRSVKGDVMKIIFERGYNHLSLRGNVSYFKVEDYSRWL